DAAVVFALDDVALTEEARGGASGRAEQAVGARVAMLRAELGDAGPRVSGFRRGPMGTALRGRAFMADQDRDARDPAVYAPACVELLSPAGAAWRGRTMVASPEPRPA